ncbi:MAG: hypothetical protein U0936_15965 [Planctomycetaceae bacterium]
MTQRDYYSMLDAFNRVPESGTPQYAFIASSCCRWLFLEYPFPETIARIAEFDTKIAALEAEVTKGVDAAFEEWRAGLIVEGKLREDSALPQTSAALMIKPDGELNDDQKKTLATDLRKHFSEKIQPTLVDKVPAIKQRDDLKKQLADYRADQMPRPMIMSDAQLS